MLLQLRGITGAADLLLSLLILSLHGRQWVVAEAQLGAWLEIVELSRAFLHVTALMRRVC